MSSDETRPAWSLNDIWRRPVIRPEAAAAPSHEEATSADTEFVQDSEVVEQIASANKLGGATPSAEEPVNFPPPPAALAPEHVAYQPYTFAPLPGPVTTAASSPFPTQSAPPTFAPQPPGSLPQLPGTASQAATVPPQTVPYGPAGGLQAPTVVPAPPIVPPAPLIPGSGAMAGMPTVVPAGVGAEAAGVGAVVSPGSEALLPSPAMRTDLAAASSGRRRKIQLRSGVTVLVFFVGLLGGVALMRMQLSAPPPPTDSFPALARSTVEPQPAAAVAQNLQRNDVHGLAQLVDGDTLTAIQSQLSPLVSIEQVTFVGSTVLGEDTVAGYVVRGRDQGGNLGIVGLTIRVRDGQVVAQ